MGRSLNKVSLIGNVGPRAFDLQTTKSGTRVAHFTLATNREIKGGEVVDWHRITAWGGLATFIENQITVGDLIFVEGHLEYSSYEYEGTKIPTAEIHIEEIIILKRSPS